MEPEPEPEPEPERVVTGPGAGGLRLVPDRAEGMGLEALTSECRRIMEIVAGADAPVMVKDVARALGREITPGKIELVRGQLRKLADRGWVSRTVAGRYLARWQDRTAADRPIPAATRGSPVGVGVSVTKNQPAEGAQDAVYPVPLPPSKPTIGLGPA